MQVGEGQQVQIVQAQPQGQTQQAQSGTGQTMQVMQQIITNTGEIQQIPVSLHCRPRLFSAHGVVFPPHTQLCPLFLFPSASAQFLSHLWCGSSLFPSYTYTETSW